MAKLTEYLMIRGAYIFPVVIASPFTQLVVPPGNRRYVNGAGFDRFTKGDNVTLLSYGVIMPENFTFFAGVPPPVSAILGEERSTPPNYFQLPCFLGANPAEWITIENKEHDLEGYCDYSLFTRQISRLPVTEDFSIVGTFPLDVYISMLNVPAAANGNSYYMEPFIKVSHNLPLS